MKYCTTSLGLVALLIQTTEICNWTNFLMKNVYQEELGKLACQKQSIADLFFFKQSRLEMWIKQLLPFQTLELSITTVEIGNLHRPKPYWFSLKISNKIKMSDYAVDVNSIRNHFVVWLNLHQKDMNATFEIGEWWLVCLSQTRLSTRNVAPLLDNRLLDLSGIGARARAHLLGDINTLFCRLEKGHQLGHMFALLLWLQITCLLRDL